MTTGDELAVAAACFLAAACVVWSVRRLALRSALLDVPNDRSSHAVPRPRVGGVGIVLPVLAVGAGLVLTGRAPPSLLVILGGAGAVAVVGLADDLRPLRARTRFVVQLAAAMVVVWTSLDRLPEAAGWLGTRLPLAVLAPAAVLALLWLTNLYNFMDGIDGLAGSQATIAALALAFVAMRVGNGVAATMLVAIAGASLGFLLFNLPPASIFMGDVGSTTLGFLLGCVPLLPAGPPVTLEPVVLALSLFVLDATFTLVRRASRGERLYEAHREHLYQRPVAAGAGHAPVLSWAIGGMTLVALCAIAWPGASGSLRAVLWGIPPALFGAGHAAAARMERRTDK